MLNSSRSACTVNTKSLLKRIFLIHTQLQNNVWQLKLTSYLTVHTRVPFCPMLWYKAGSSNWCLSFLPSCLLLFLTFFWNGFPSVDHCHIKSLTAGFPSLWPSLSLILFLCHCWDTCNVGNRATGLNFLLKGVLFGAFVCVCVCL